jgi:hypothetical protein
MASLELTAERDSKDPNQIHIRGGDNILLTTMHIDCFHDLFVNGCGDGNGNRLYEALRRQPLPVAFEVQIMDLLGIVEHPAG